VESGTKILFRGLPYEVPASGIEPYEGRSEVHHLAARLTEHSRRFSKAKEHRRAKTRRRKRAKRNGVEVKTVRVAQDYRIRAHECKMVRVDGNFSEDKEWLVERNLLSNAEDSFFSVPNTLISARKPIIPVSNMNERPRFVRKGEILGTLTDPQEYFDKPGNADELWSLKSKTAIL
jgi:hypothetical protein